MIKRIICTIILLFLSINSYSDYYKYKINPRTGHWDLWSDNVSTSTYSSNSSLLNGTSNYFLLYASNTATLQNRFLGKSLFGVSVSSSFPNAQAVFSKGISGHTYIENIGLVGESAAETGKPSIGLGGVSKTNGYFPCYGVAGRALANDTDSGGAIGIEGLSEASHSGGSNISFYASALNGLLNYSFYGNSGDIYNNGSATITGNIQCSSLTITGLGSNVAVLSSTQTFTGINVFQGINVSSITSNDGFSFYNNTSMLGISKITDNFILVRGTDTSIINIALQSASSGTLIQILPNSNGFYTQTSPIQIQLSSITLRGLGLQTIIKPYAYSVWASTTHCIDSYSKDGIVIDNIVYDCSQMSAVSTEANTIFIEAGLNCKIINCQVIQSPSNAIAMRGTGDSIISNCVVNKPSATGILFTSYSSRKSAYLFGKGNIISNNILTGITSNGIVDTYQYSGVISGNSVYGTGGNGISLSVGGSGYTVTISGNGIYGVGTGIYMNQSGASISGNNIANVTSIGIQISTLCDGVNIMANNIDTTGSDGILLTGSAGNPCSNINLIGNNIKNAANNSNSINVANAKAVYISNNNLSSIVGRSERGVYIQTASSVTVAFNNFGHHDTSEITVNSTADKIKIIQNFFSDNQRILNNSADAYIISISTTNLYGINTSTPTSTLTVNGSIDFGNATAVIKSSTSFGVQITTGVHITGTLDVPTIPAKIHQPYATFYSTTSQSCLVANTTQQITLDGSIDAHGITWNTGGCMYTTYRGEYLVGFSAVPQGTNGKSVYIFPRVNGTDVPYSNTVWKFTGNTSPKVMTVFYNLDLQAGDCLNFIMYSDDTNTQLLALPASTTPVAPAMPSIIFTINYTGDYNED